MERFIKGQIVVVPFPFSDLSNAKRRPALVVSTLKGDDLLLCQITSKVKSDGYSISLAESDLADGSLKQKSNLRPNRLFTADKNIILYKIGRINSKKLNELIEKVIAIVKS